MKSLELEAEKWADDYVEQGWFKLEYSSFGQTAKECQKAVIYGFNKALKILSEKEGRELFLKPRFDGDNFSGYDVVSGSVTMDEPDEIYHVTEAAPLRARVRVLEDENQRLKAECDDLDSQAKSFHYAHGQVVKMNEKLQSEKATLRAQLETCKDQRDDELEDNCWSEIIDGREVGRPFEQAKAKLDLELQKKGQGDE
jgi:uncharacterized small protein (DUF1192 family)